MLLSSLIPSWPLSVLTDWPEVRARWGVCDNTVLYLQQVHVYCT